MRRDVLKVISSAKEITNAVVMTHNIDFVFLQTVVLSTLSRCGQPTITAFADGGCAAESFAHQKNVLTSLGVRYRVVPVDMGPRFRFHPKAILLSGEQAATLLVGSGNLTFGGWRENAEIWTHFESGRDGAAPFLAFQDYLAEVVKRIALPGAVKAEIDDAFSPKSKTWLSAKGTNDQVLIGRVGSGPALIEQMLDSAGPDPVDELFICAPYFDDEGSALRELVTRVGANRTTVLCQAGRTTLQKQAWIATAPIARLQNIDFTHENAENEERSAFVHAKFYGFRRENEVIVFSGSANCSRAALTVPGKAGNAELMTRRAMTLAAFEKDLLGELRLSSTSVVLAGRPFSDADDHPGATHLRVLAARFESGDLLVGYAPKDVSVTECLVDDLALDFMPMDAGVLSVSCANEPKAVKLRAMVEGKLISSEPTWIDLEKHLRATARGRNLADSIRARIRPGAWSADGWAELLEVLCRHLSYMPPVRAAESGQHSGRGTADELQEFTAADVFSASYRAPKLNAVDPYTGVSEDGHVLSLQRLLLRWFGAGQQEPDDEPDINDDENKSEDDEIVDRPERLPSTPGSSVAPTERDSCRIAQLLDQLQAALTSAEFLSERGPEHLAADLKVASTLLCVGLRKGWVERERFLDLTRRVWSSLFFSSAHRRNAGWLEFLFDTSEDRDKFIKSMRSAQLSAALIGWYLAVPADGAQQSFATVRFKLAAALAVGRMPWLWHSEDLDELAAELGILLTHTAEPRLSPEEIMVCAEAEWKQLMQRGHALRRFESAVSNMSPDSIREKIAIEELRPGDLLWQGEAGFYIMRHGWSRNSGTDVSVSELRGEGVERRFKASHIVPVRTLLEEEVVPRVCHFGDRPREVLREFIRELSAAFTAGPPGS
ncbi:MAG: hypothetical protein F4Y02_08930 [Chloroflexi bacterium]|nr:hypothetical protein [Chloroflexota bacterium]